MNSCAAIPLLFKANNRMRFAPFEKLALTFENVQSFAMDQIQARRPR